MQTKINGNEARVTVMMGSKGLADLKYDFLLFKTESGWKIFNIISKVQATGSDPYAFYAEEAKQGFHPGAGV